MPKHFPLKAIIWATAASMGLNTTDLNAIRELLTPEQQLQFSRGVGARICSYNNKRQISEAYNFGTSHNATYNTRVGDMMEQAEQTRLAHGNKILSDHGFPKF